jgi:hypothetical protein
MYQPVEFDQTNISIEDIVDVLNKQPIEIVEYSNNKHFSLSTDPDIGIITIMFTDLKCHMKIRLHLQNLKKSMVYEYKFFTITDHFTKTIDISYYPEGIYHLQVQIEDQTFLQKLIKQ